MFLTSVDKVHQEVEAVAWLGEKGMKFLKVNRTEIRWIPLGDHKINNLQIKVSKEGFFVCIIFELKLIISAVND